MALARPLTTHDHAAALTLYRVLAGDQAITTNPDHFTALLAHPGTTLFGAEDQSALQAMVTLHILPNIKQGGRPYGLIENVVSNPKMRGKGYARMAMQAAIDAAWAADAYKIMLLTGQNTGALGFYESLGFASDQKHGLQLRRIPPRVS